MDNHPVPTLLYHYTDARGLLGIIESHAIWATHLHYLNDAQEFAYAADLADQVLKEQRASAEPRESEDPHALAAFAQGWSDVVELTIAPVLEDQALSEVLQRARRASASAAAHANDVPPETYPEDVPVAPETTPGTTKPPYAELA
jgi:hypothetical protein